MRCPACKQYVPDGLGLKICPSCNADITVAVEAKTVSASDIAPPIIPEAKLTPPPYEASKSDLKSNGLAPDEIKTKRESLGFVLATCLLYAIACKFIYGSEYFRTLSMAGLKVLAYTTFFGEFFVLKVIEAIIYLRALWVVGSCAQRLVGLNRSKLPAWCWVCLQLAAPLFFAKFGAAIIPFYFFSQFESLANGKALVQSPYLHKRKSREEVDRDQKRAIFFLISSIVLLAGIMLVVLKFDSQRRKATQPKNVYYYLKNKQYAEAVDILSKDKNLSHSDYHNFVQAYEGLGQWANAFGMQVALMQDLKEHAGSINHLLFKLFELQGKKDETTLILSAKERIDLLAKLFHVHDESKVLEKNKVLYAKWEVFKPFLATGEYFHRNLRFDVAERLYKQGIEVVEKEPTKTNYLISQVGYMRQRLIDAYVLTGEYEKAMDETNKLIAGVNAQFPDYIKELEVWLEVFRLANQHRMNPEKFYSVFGVISFMGKPAITDKASWEMGQNEASAPKPSMAQEEPNFISVNGRVVPNPKKQS